MTPKGVTPKGVTPKGVTPKGSGTEGLSVSGDRLVYKTALSLATIATSGLIRLVFSLLVGHVFDTPLLGHANVIISAAVFGTLLCSPGIGQAVARQMAMRGLDPALGPGRSLIVRATTAHHLICLALAIAVGVLVPANAWPERLLAVALTIGYGSYTYYKAVLYGVDWVRRYAVLELAWDALFLVAMVAVVVSGSRELVLAPMVLVYLGFSAGAHLALFRRGGAGRRPTPPGPAAGGTDRSSQPPAVPHLWTGIAAFAVVTTLGTASSAGFLQLSQVFAARAGTPHESGLFAAALSLVVPAYLLPRAVSVVLFPAMARAAGRSDRARLKTHLLIGTNVLAAALLPAFVLAGVLATALMRVAYGPEYVDGGTTFAIMVWATWVSIASVPAVNGLSGDTGRAYLVPAAASVAGFLVGLTVWFSAGTSIERVAWAYLIGSLVQSAVPMVEAARRHGVPGGWFAARVLVVAGGGLAVALLVVHARIGFQLAVGCGLAAVAAVAVIPELRALLRLRPVRGAP